MERLQRDLSLVEEDPSLTDGRTREVRDSRVTSQARPDVDLKSRTPTQGWHVYKT